MELNRDPEISRLFAEENLRIGIDNRKAVISNYESIAHMLPPLLDMPDDVNISELWFEARQK
jgi:hypothetical protein